MPNLLTWDYKARLAGQVAADLTQAITAGGSTGIGFHAAKELAQHGGHVIIAARRLEECRKAADTIKVNHLQIFNFQVLGTSSINTLWVTVGCR